MQLLLALLVSVLAALCCEAFTPKSLVQACRGPVAIECSAEPNVMKCLKDVRPRITDPTCIAWLTAKDACVVSARQVCGPRVSYHECLITAKPADLGSTCSDSQYFRSVVSAHKTRQVRLRRGIGM